MGRGYLMVEHEGSHLSGFVRQGRLTLDQTGRLVWGNPSDGWIVQPQIIIPIDHTTIEVLHDGGVYYGQSSAGHLQQAGQLQVAVFMSEEHLNEIVPGVFGFSQNAGAANLVNPGTNGAGFLQQSWLESSPDSRAFDWSSFTSLAVVGLSFLALAELRKLRVEMAKRQTVDEIVAVRYAQAPPQEVAVEV